MPLAEVDRQSLQSLSRCAGASTSRCCSHSVPERRWRMEQNQTSPARFVEHPLCERCHVTEWLIRIEPVQPGCEKRTYECPHCGQREFMLVRRTSSLRNRAA